MNETILLATALTSAIFQTVKQIDTKNSFNRFYPLLVLILGFGVGLLLKLNVIDGLIVGLSANGTYAVVKKPVENTVKMVKENLK